MNRATIAGATVPPKAEARSRRLPRLAWSLVLALAVLHYDFWLWDDDRIVLGFVPIGLLWQVLISIGAGVVWALVVRWGWPVQLEEWASRSPTDGEPPGK